MHGTITPWRTGCSETAEQLSGYLEAELVGWRLRRVRRHLATCGRCRSVLGSLGRTIDLLHELGQSTASKSPSVADAVVDRVRRHRSA